MDDAQIDLINAQLSRMAEQLCARQLRPEGVVMPHLPSGIEDVILSRSAAKAKDLTKISKKRDPSTLSGSQDDRKYNYCIQHRSNYG